MNLGESCLGASFMWGELFWDELSLGRVVLHPERGAGVSLKGKSNIGEESS